MTIAKKYLILMFALASISACTQREYVLINDCPPVTPTEWRTTAEMYKELKKYESAYWGCVGNERKDNHE